MNGWLGRVRMNGWLGRVLAGLTLLLSLGLAGAPGASLAPATATVRAAPLLPPAAPAAVIQLPAPGARVTLPLHLQARVGRPGDALIAALRWRDGASLASRIRVLRGPDGQSLVLASLDWTQETGPLPTPPTQPATLEVRTQAGHVLARQSVVILSPHDPDVRTIKLYWVLGERVYPVGQPRVIVLTPRIGAAALTELLWGPGPRNFVGFTTALPTPPQVLTYPGRRTTWGSRVTLRSLRIVGGVATADFSPELRAYGGGALRVRLIREQITRTLRQFPTVRTVRITMAGQASGVLEP